MTRKPYPSNLKDAEWAVLEPLLPPHKPIGSRREVELREVVNALMYVADNGIKWRALPHDFPAGDGVWVLPTLDAQWGVGSGESSLESASQGRGRTP
jgi:transposase